MNRSNSSSIKNKTKIGPFATKLTTTMTTTTATNNNNNALQNQTNNLRQNLASERYETKQTADCVSKQVELKQLRDQANSYAKKIDAEYKKIDALEEQIAMTRMKIAQQKNTTTTTTTTRVGDNGSSRNDQITKKQVCMLEEKLNQSLIRFNEKAANNKQLRNRIDDYRRERSVFDDIYKNLERELDEQSKEMSRVLQDGRNVCKARDEAHDELMSWKKQAEESKRVFQKEWNELGRLMAQDKKRQEERASRYLEESCLSPPPPPPPRVDQHADDNTSHDKKNRRQDEKNKDAIGCNREQRHLNDNNNDNNDTSEHSSNDATTSSGSLLSETQLRDLEEAMTKITNATGINDVDEMITLYLENEENNFSRFNYVAYELGCEIEQLERQIACANKDIERAKGQAVSIDSQNNKVKKDLERRRLKAKAKAEQYIRRHQAAADTTYELMSGIERILELFKSTSSDAGMVMDETALEASQGVTETNVMQYLEIIEQKTSQMMQQQNPSAETDVVNDEIYDYVNFAQSLNNKRVHPTISGKMNVVWNVPTLNVNPPTTDDFSSEESDNEDDERPLTREELQFKTFRGMKFDDKKKQISIKRK